MSPALHAAATALISVCCCCAAVADEGQPGGTSELTVDVDRVMVDITAPRAAREPAPPATQYSAGTRTQNS